MSRTIQAESRKRVFPPERAARPMRDRPHNFREAGGFGAGSDNEACLPCFIVEPARKAGFLTVRTRAGAGAALS